MEFRFKPCYRIKPAKNPIVEWADLLNNYRLVRLLKALVQFYVLAVSNRGWCFLKLCRHAFLIDF